MILSANKISKRFIQGQNNKIVLDELSFSANENDFITINGPSGSGKSTLLYILGLLEKPDSGSIEINGVCPTSGNHASQLRADNIGFLFQNHYLMPQLTALDNVLLATKVSAKNTITKDETREIFKHFNLTEIINKYPSQISGGESQRVAFIRSIINKPKIVIADEPTGNLDLDNTYRLMDIIEKYIDDFGITFIIATHDNLITKKSNRQLYIQRGKLV